MEISNKSDDFTGRNACVFPFLALYKELNEILDSGCENIFALMLKRSKRHTTELLSGNCGPWIRDSDLLAKLVTLKGLAEIVSRSCTKLTIVVTKNPSEVNLTSILREMSDQVSSFIGSYMYVSNLGSRYLLSDSFSWTFLTATQGFDRLLYWRSFFRIAFDTSQVKHALNNPLSESTTV